MGFWERLYERLEEKSEQIQKEADEIRAEMPFVQNESTSNLIRMYKSYSSWSKDPKKRAIKIVLDHRGVNPDDY